METETEVAPPRRRPGWRKPVFMAAFVAFIGVWAFGFWYDANRPAPEPLDAASQRAAAAACRAAISKLAVLEPLPSPPVLTKRIARVRSEDAIFTDLVATFRAIHPTDGDGAKAIQSFATDWQHLTAARERYADELSAGKTRPDLVIPVDPTKAPITIRMKEYAQIHRLNVCTPDSLQGEVVEGAREYPRVL
jgi:hypothetical protein